MTDSYYNNYYNVEKETTATSKGEEDQTFLAFLLASADRE